MSRTQQMLVHMDMRPDLWPTIPTWPLWLRAYDGYYTTYDGRWYRVARNIIWQIPALVPDRTGQLLYALDYQYLGQVEGVKHRQLRRHFPNYLMTVLL